MKRGDRGLPPELEAFLAHRAIQRRVPPEMRARALARARATIPPGRAISPAPLEAPMPTSGAPQHRVFRVALVLLIAVGGVSVGALAALHHRSVQMPAMASPESPPPLRNVPAVKASGSSRPVHTPDATLVPRTSPARPVRSGPKEDPLTAELELLQRAQAAYSRRDFPVALRLIAEHARRFSRGHLAEQREALRVRSLIGSGRVDEAHRASAAFAAHFPRSVLLPQIEGPAESSEP